MGIPAGTRGINSPNKSRPLLATKTDPRIQCTLLHSERKAVQWLWEVGPMSLVRKPAGMELIDLLDRVLDKGIVVDASSRLYLIGSSMARQKRHLVVDSIETFLYHAEARVVAKLNRRQPLRSLEHSPLMRARRLP